MKRKPTIRLDKDVRKDQNIAGQACQDLDIKISRGAVARIRTGDEKQPSLPTKAELFDMAKEAEAFEKEQMEQRQLWLNFDTEPELKQVAEECSNEPPPRARNETQQSFIEQLQQDSQLPRGEIGCPPRR